MSNLFHLMGYDLLGLNSVKYTSVHLNPDIGVDCGGGSCDGGCTNGCSSCSPGCNGGGIDR